MSFAAYAVEAFAYECEPDPFIVQVIDHGWQISWHIFLSQLTAAATVAVVTFVNCWSVELATKVQDIFCSFKLGAVAVIIAGGAYRWGFGFWNQLHFFFRMALGNYEHVATGFKVIK